MSTHVPMRASLAPGRAPTGAPLGSGDSPRVSGSAVWWLRPIWAIPLFVVPTAIGAFVIPNQDYLTNWGTPKYFEAPALLSVLAAAAALALPSLIVPRIARHADTRNLWTAALYEEEAIFLRRAYRVLMALTLFGYVAWAYLGITRGVSTSELASLFSDQTSAYALKATLTPVTGLTTFTQFGMAAAGLGTFVYLKTRRSSVRVGVGLLVLLCAARALVYSERLALIEVLVPVLVVLVHHQVATRGLRLTRRHALLPLLAIPVVTLVFAGFEYTRSFQFYSSQSSQLNLITFSAERLEGYYATSYNNSVVAENGFWLPGESHIPYFTFAFLWDFPLLKGAAYTSLTGINPATRWPGALSLYANPEFNNPGGITSPLADLGVPVGLIFLTIGGFLLAFVFRRFARGDPLGILLYPIVFVGILDLPREFYWGSGRTFPSLVGVAIIALAWAHRYRARADPEGLRPQLSLQ